MVVSMMPDYLNDSRVRGTPACGYKNSHKQTTNTSQQSLTESKRAELILLLLLMYSCLYISASHYVWKPRNVTLSEIIDTMDRQVVHR